MRFWRWSGPCLAACLAAASLAACSRERSADVNGVRLRAADQEPGNWLSVGRTWGEQRFSPLDQIDARNVKRLGLAWYADLDTDRGVEATPLVIDGVLYNTTPWNITTAYNAATGDVLWRFDPQVPRRFGGLACCDIVTRGLAAWNGKIYVATLDGRLIALDAKNGTPVWSVQTLDGYLRSLQLTGLNALAYADLDDKDMASASTLSGVFQLLAQAVAVGGAAAILHVAQRVAHADHLAAAHIYPAFLIIGALSLASLIWFVRLPANAGASLRRP